MRTLLLFPPHCLPYQPWSTLPALKSYLQSQGLEVFQRDLNIESYHVFLSQDFLRGVRRKLEQVVSLLESRASLSRPDQHQLLRTFRAFALSGGVIDQIESAKHTLKDPRQFYDFTALSSAREVIVNAFEMISMAYHPAKLTHEAFTIKDAHASIETLLQYTDNALASPFVGMYEKFEQSLADTNPQLIGVSISLQEQILPGLTLTRMVRRSLPDAKIVLGGYTLSKVAGRIANCAEFFPTFADYLVVGEGEKPLLALIQALRSGTQPASVPGLVFRSGQRVRMTGQAECLEGSELPTPDYEGFPLDRYLSPEPVLAVAASRGCYWGQCAFCDRGKASGFRYRSRAASAIVDDLESLAGRHGAQHFTFTDDAIPPKALSRIADEIQKRRLVVRLSADSRFDAGFTPDLCRRIFKAGFVHLRFGLESASDRVLQHMRKGTRRETIEATLKNLSREGVCTHLYAFFGFPTETPVEAEETVEFVVKNKDFISSASCTTFGLLDQSPAFSHPEDFGIATVDRAQDVLFKYFFDFECSSGLTHTEARQKADAFFAAMEREYDDFRVLGHLEWGHQFLFCAKYGSKNSELRTHSPGDIADTCCPGKADSSFAPRLGPGVVYYESPYDLAEIAENMRSEQVGEALPRDSRVVFDSRSSRIASVSENAAEILRLCNSSRTIRGIAVVLAERHSLPVSEVERAVSAFVDDLGRLGMSMEDIGTDFSPRGGFPTS